MPYKDREKQREYQKEWSRNKFSDPVKSSERKEKKKEWRRNNREKVNEYDRERRKGSVYRASLSRRNRRIKTSLQQWYQSIKLNISCAKCGENHPATLDFHHNDPKEKVDTIVNMVRRKFPRYKILAEMAKCTVLCANCHRKFHFWKQYSEGVPQK